MNLPASSTGLGKQHPCCWPRDTRAYRSSGSWLAGLLACLWLTTLPVPASGQQGTYLDQEEALARAFPDGTQVHRLSRLVPREIRDQIAAEFGLRYRQTRTRCFQGTQDSQVIGYACIDNMIGKERLITYIVAIDHSSGEITLLEVMQYREAIGGEVRFAYFTDQIVGLELEDNLYLDQGVRRISGATLSSRALAKGSRKILALYQYYLQHLPPP